ncbi:MAG: hypothetical protein IJS75_03625 [Bacteroidales bacterium]|nr:hypothetical protein [Bacteroidales bacterium]MBQ8461595.1 hypothetical protein [Bacteroidales bacterium]
MRYYSKLLTVAVLLFSAISAYAQLSLRENPQPQSPQAAEMTKYGTHNVNMYTGRISISIPIGTYKDTDFEIPVSLNYSYNGFRPNEQPSEAGLGWTVSCGGVITREVRGIPDEETGNFVFYTSGGCLMTELRPHDNIPWSTYAVYNPTIEVEALTQTASYDKPINAALVFNNNRYDANPDVYHFSFLGHSGSFVRRRDGSFAVFDTSGGTTYTINKENEPFGSTQVGCYSEITITTSDGYKYYFGSINNSTNYCERVTSANHEHEPQLIGSIISWKLRKIVSPGGRELEFLYAYKSDPIKIRGFGANLWYSTADGLHSFNLYGKDTYSFQAPIEQVMSENGPVITFEYSTKSSSCSGLFINGAGYDNMLNPDNATILLDRITVMEEETELSYLWSSNGNKYPFLSEVSSANTGVFEMEYKNINSGYFPEYYSQAYDHWGYLNSSNRTDCESSRVVWSNISSLTNNYGENLDDDKHSNFSAASLGLLTKIIYPTGGSSEFTYEANTSAVAINKLYADDFYLREYSSSLTGPGARIKRIVNKDSDGSVKDSLSYCYDGIGGKPSGRMLIYPRHQIQYAGTLAGNQLIVSYGTTSNMNRHGDVVVEYPCVTEYHSDGSKTEYEFTDWSMYPDSLIYSTQQLARRYGPGANDYAYLNITNNPTGLRRILAPATSLSPARGKPYKKKEYAAGGVSPLKTTEYVYDTLNVETFTEYLNIGDACGIIKHFAFTPQLISITESTHYTSEDVQFGSSRTYNNYNQVTSETTSRPDGASLRTVYTYPSDYPNNTVLVAMATAGVNGYPVTVTTQIKESGSNTWTTTSATKYTFAEFTNCQEEKMYLPVTIEKQDVATGVWKTEETRTYDDYGNITQSIDAAGTVTAFTWYEDGRGPHTITQNYNQPDARMWTIEYYRPGLPSSITGPDGITKNWAYDAAGRLIGESETGIGKIFNMVYSTKSRQR